MDSEGNLRACYWTGAARTDLDVSTIPNLAKSLAGPYAITVSDGVVYTAGCSAIGGVGSDLCYWKNGAFTDLGVIGSYIQIYRVLIVVN
jgi:hypothetical protein